MQETRRLLVWSLGWEGPLEKEMATHSSILAWEVPWIEEPGGLQSMGLQRVGHDWEGTQCIQLCVCVMLSKKYSHNLKVGSYFIWWECLGLWAWETASQLWENCYKEAGGETKFATNRGAVWTSKIKYQVKEYWIEVWEPSFTFGGQESLMAVTFFIY